MGRLAFALAAMIALAGCGGADETAGAGGSDGVATPDNGGALPPGDDDSSRDDGSGWPRWKNPCPGPACDPYRQDPRWLVDPPPDLERMRTTIVRPPERAASPAER